MYISKCNISYKNIEMLSNKLLTNLTSELQFPTTRIPRMENES